MDIVKALITLPGIKCLPLLKYLFGRSEAGWCNGKNLCFGSDGRRFKSYLLALPLASVSSHKEWDDNSLTLNCCCEDKRKQHVTSVCHIVWETQVGEALAVDGKRGRVGVRSETKTSLARCQSTNKSFLLDLVSSFVKWG